MKNMDNNTAGTTDEDAISDKIISDSLLQTFELVVFIIIFTVVSLCGMACNIINIFVFIKMGLSDTVNISFLALSLSDFFFLFLTLLLSLCYYPGWDSADLPFRLPDIKLLVIGWPHFFFKRVSNWITAFVTFERCICIALPLKAHNIITPSRTVIIIVTNVVVMAITVSPVYISQSYAFVFDNTTNRTVLELQFDDNHSAMVGLAAGINIALTIVNFVWTFSCTLVLVVCLQRNIRWRAKATNADKTELVSNRDKRVIKMVTAVSGIFIVAFLPDAMVVFYQALDPRLTFHGAHENLLLFLLGFSETLLAVNASVNIFVYFKMSSKYRETFEVTVFKLKK